jgi:hypothetical protein
MTNNLKNHSLRRSLKVSFKITDFMKTKALIILCAATLVMGDLTSSRAAGQDPVEVITDVTLVRPGCFVATLIGSAFFVLALPIAAVSGSVKQTANTLVVVPAQATFTRPIGDFTDIEYD